MTTGTTVRETGADGEILGDIPGAIIRERPLAVGAGELALKELPASPDGSEWIPVDEEGRRIRGHQVTPSGADLIEKRFGDSFVEGVGGQGAIDQLRFDGRATEGQREKGNNLGSTGNTKYSSLHNQNWLVVF
jgi:hypothetical protein